MSELNKTKQKIDDLVETIKTYQSGRRCPKSKQYMKMVLSGLIEGVRSAKMKFK